MPEILTVLTDESHILYQGKASEIFYVESGTLSSDGKKIIAKVADIKSGKVKVTVTAGEEKSITAKGTVVTFAEAFEVLGITKVPETEKADKVKVTITVNKELSSSQVPSGWTLGEDGKSIWKVMNKGVLEELTLVTKDGITITYTVGTIIQAGVNNTILIVIAAIAIVGTVVFVSSRKVLK